MKIDPNLPINKLAKISVYKNKDRKTDFYCNDTIASMSPLPTQMYKGVPEHDLTGKKVGRFIVIGLALFLAGRKKERRWVVKCSCGRHQMMAPKAIKKDHEFMACVECSLTYKLKTGIREKCRQLRELQQQLSTNDSPA